MKKKKLTTEDVSKIRNIWLFRRKPKGWRLGMSVVRDGDWEDVYIDISHPHKGEPYFVFKFFSNSRWRRKCVRVRTEDLSLYLEHRSCGERVFVNTDYILSADENWRNFVESVEEHYVFDH